jgi:hypothetical protein
VLLQGHALSMEAEQMLKLMIGISAATLLSAAAFAQTDKSIPARPDPSVNANQPTTGSKVAPLPAPDASTQPGQDRGNAEILEQSQQNAPGTGGTSKPGVAGLPGSKSGATKTPESLPQSGSTTPPTLQQDQSRVPGITGSKSGMAPKQQQ